MPDIFLSYSRDDQATARLFAEGFERAGFSVWWDQTLSAGEAYDKVTEKALKEAKAVVVLWSKKSVDSRWVRAEATMADRNKTLVPVMIEACERPIMFELTHTAELSHWQGEVQDKAWQTFVTDLLRFVKKDTANPQAPIVAVNSPKKTHSRMIATAIVASVLLVTGIAWWALGHRRSDASSATGANEVTLAVLPFADMSAAHDQEYFSDGLTEEILNQLAQVQELRVTGRTSSFSFKGKNEDLRDIGQKLGVDNLLEGSVRKDGNQLRITAQLISSKSGAHLWSQTYDRELSKVFALQEEIARDVSQALSIKLDVGATSRANGGTTNIDAYDKYLQAQQQWYRAATSEQYSEAAQGYRAALALDSDFALAWYGLYRSLNFLGVVGAAAEPRRKEISEAVARITALAPDSAWTQEVRSLEFKRMHQWREAMAASSAALAIATTADTQWSHGYTLLQAGYTREALEHLQRAILADPLSCTFSMTYQQALDQAGRLGEAQTENERSNCSGNTVVAAALYRLWLRPDANPAAIRSLLATLLANNPSSETWNGITLANWDKPEAARAALRQTFADPANRTAGLALRAEHYGERELAFAVFRQQLVDESGVGGNFLFIQLTQPGFREDPRFKAILRDMGLVDLYRSTGKWPDACKPLGADDFECH